MLFSIYAEEIENPLRNSKNYPSEDVLNFLENNPFGKLTKMGLSNQSNLTEYNRQKVLFELENRADSGIRVEAEKPISTGGAISWDDFGNRLFLEINATNLEKVGGFEKITEYLKQSRKVFPKFSWAGASADDRENDFWIDVAKTEPLPDCFGSRLGWYHVISRRGYEPYFKRKDLLNTPALKTEELDDGTICILSYAHPLDFSKPEVTEKIIEISNYLTEKWYEFDPSPTFDLIEQK